MIRRIAAQTRMEIVLALRQGERMIVMLVVPLGILLFFSKVEVVRYGRDPLEFLVPGVLALAVVSTSMVSLGIATGFERQVGVLKRLGVTPLGRGGLLAAKTISVAVVEVGQAIVLLATAYALGWRWHGSVVAAVSILALGTAAFSGIGFGLAGRLRAEANLAVANAAFLIVLSLGGIVVPLSTLPGPVRTVARVLPAEPLASALRAALAGRLPAGAVLVLAAWTVGAWALAAASFRWE
jgi:ABC-2 type transport system permease protein